MSFVLSIALDADIPALGSITYAAFQEDAHNMTSRFFPGIDPTAIQQWRTQQLSTAFRDETCRFIKITDNSNGQVAAYARWQLPHIPQANEKHKHDEELNESLLPVGTNVGLMKAFGKALDEKRAKHMKVEQDYLLDTLATSPQYQRQGCASMLIAWGLEIADKTGARAYLEATPAGHGLYRRFGWENIDEIVFDCGQYGSTGVQKTTVMLRPSSTVTVINH